MDELKKRFRDDNNDEDEKNMDELDLKNDEIEGKKENSKNIEEKKENSLINNKNINKKKIKQNKIQQQKLKKKKIMSKYFLKLNLFFALSISTIILISLFYYILTIVVTTKMKRSYKIFDAVLEEINGVYFNSFKIFLQFKSQLELYYNTKDKSKLQIPEDKSIERPKIGNSLLEITHNTKYSAESIQMIKDIYSNNACLALSNNDAKYIVCEGLFSSILTKGMEQAIIQMSTMITSCVDELNSLKDNSTLEKIYNYTTNYFSYEIFVGEFLLESFLKTQNIFESFREDEKKYIFKIYKIVLCAFSVVYIILLIIMIYSIYKYKNITNSFFNFIGIIPSKFIADDDNLYKTLLKLEQNYY